MEELATEGRPTRNLSCTQLLLDQLGWVRVIEAIDTQFVCLFEEQHDAALRTIHTGEKLVRVSILQFAFESPMQGDERTSAGLSENHREPLIPFPVRLSRLFADEVCIQIVEAANQREISVPQFYAEFGGKSVNHIRRRFRKLEDIGWLKRVGRKGVGKRRSAVEYFYRATGPVIADDNGPWANVPDSLGETDGWKTFEELSALVKEALKAGTFDAREDRYLAWSLLLLDQQGLKKVTAVIQALRAFVLKEQERAKIRIKKSGEKPIVTTVALAAFESLKESVREP
jgi:hypothetical protein